MKKYFLLLAITILCSCDKDNFNNKNPYIPNYNFSVNIDTNLPLYSNLNFVSNGQYISEGGALGLIVFNTGSGYTAYDAACPNQPITSCSTMNVNGINGVCPCDSASYSLFTGQSSTAQQYPMKAYRVEKNGSVIHVYN
ncbi:MAG: hypothetical protein V4548_07465 [Bacteroidota bacterium]